MIEWKEYKLGDLIKDIAAGPFGSNLKVECFVESGFPIIDGANLKGVKVTDNITKYVTEEKARSLHRAIAKRNDVVVTISGNVGQIAYIPDNSKYLEYLVSQRQFRATFDVTKVDVPFLVYYFHTRVGQHKILSFANQVGVPALAQPLKNFREIELELPPIEVQKRIAGVLSSLDDKIDLLHRENATLEQMAETLFRQWFVVEAKEEWEEGKLGDEFAFTMGQSPSGDSFNEEGIGVPMYQGNADFGFRFPTRRVFTTLPTRFAEVNDTLISVRAPVGAQNMATEKCCIGRGVAAFRYKGIPSYYSYTYYKLKSLLEEIKQFNDNGTVFGSISKSDFENLDIVIPDDETIKMFQKQVKVIDDKIINNNIEIQTLIQTRDGLLPKLMSNEINFI